MACSLLVNIHRRSITRCSTAIECLWKKDTIWGDRSKSQYVPASEKYNTFTSRELLQMGPNFSYYKNITELLENSTWTETHYFQAILFTMS